MTDTDLTEYYTVLDESGSGGRYRSSECTAGPWDGGLQHGGPPSALLVRAAERAAAAAGRDDVTALRFAGDFVGPVPVADLEVTATVVRAARSAVLVDVVALAAGRTCLQAQVWLLANADTTSIVAQSLSSATPPEQFADLGADFGYGRSIEWRSLGVSLHVPGPGATWARARVPVVDGETPSGLARVVLVGDSASGISAELPWDRWTFPNVDLSVHLFRPVQGEWLLVDARTTLGPTGTALAGSVVSDVHGEVGSTAQTLVVRPRAGH